jgi:hypothetical protein
VHLGAGERSPAGASIAMTNGIGSDVGLTLNAPAPTTVVLPLHARRVGPVRRLGDRSPSVAALSPSRGRERWRLGVALPTQPQVQYADGGAPVAQAGVIITASIIPIIERDVRMGATATTDATGLATFSGLTIVVTESERDVTVRYSTPRRDAGRRDGAPHGARREHLSSPRSSARASREGGALGRAAPHRAALRVAGRHGASSRAARRAVHITATGNVSDFGTDTCCPATAGVRLRRLRLRRHGRGKVTIVAEGTP